MRQEAATSGDAREVARLDGQLGQWRGSLQYYESIASPPPAPSEPATRPPASSGGAQGGPTSTGAAAPAAPPAGEPDRQATDDYIAANYPQFAWLTAIPEMKQLFDDAQAGVWELSKFVLELQKTQWWQATSDTARWWESVKATDTAQSERLRAEKRNLFADQALRLGVDLDPQTLAQLVENSFLFGWSEAQNTDAIVNHVSFGPTTGGLAAGALQTVKSLEREYAFPITDSERNAWAKKFLTGEATEETLRADAIERAKSLYDPTGTGLSKALDAGQTIRSLAGGYIQIAARNLEIDPETIDLIEPKWSRPLMQVDPKTNERVQMSLADWDQTIKTDEQYGWKNTKQANDQADSLVLSLLRSFGEEA